MTVLTTAKNRTKYLGIVSNRNPCVAHVGPGIEEHTLVTLTCTKQIAGNGVGNDLLKRTRYTYCATCHYDYA